MKLIIDTDVGIDDAVALLMVLAHPRPEVLAVTTVMGNVSLRQATYNAGVILDVAGTARDVPLYKGCGKPLLQYQPENAIDIHGTDGLGGMAATGTTRTPEAEHAALALIRLVRQHPGQITLLTLGPLTNIALAFRLDSSVLKNLERLVIMGGAVDGRGNTSPPAEFNIKVDPESAKIVFDACNSIDLDIQLISWEASLAHAVPVGVWETLIDGSSPAAHFVQGLTEFLKQNRSVKSSGVTLWPDPLAAAVALSPAIVSDYETRYVAIEAGHNFARGQTIVDYRPRSKTPANIQIIRKVDMQEFKNLLHLAVK